MPGKAYEYLISRPLAVTPEALEAGIAIATREPVPEAVQAMRGRRVDGAESVGVETRDGVRIIPISGPIFRYADWFIDLCGGVTVEALALDLRAAAADPAAGAILLYVDSPGGEATGIGELADMIRSIDAGTKPVWAYVHGLAASAAYWLSAAAGRVVMAPAAFAGSIGVVMAYPRKKDDVRSVEFVSSQSPMKRPDVATEAGRASVQRTVDDLADVFLAAVASYRDATPESVAADFGGGGILIASRAVAAGMADDVGTFEGTLAELAVAATRPQSRGGIPARTTPAKASADAPIPQPAQGDPRVFKLFRKQDGTLAATAQPAEGDVDITKDVVAALQDATPAPDAEALPERVSAGAISLAETPEFVALKAQLDAAEARNETLAAGLAREADIRLTADARAHADAPVAERRLPPAAKATLAALFAQAARDDAASAATVTHDAADGPKAGTRVEALKGLVALLPTDAERHASLLAGSGTVSAFESVARGEIADGEPRPENVARLKRLAGLDG